MSKPPKVVIPGMNRGAGMPAGFAIGRRRNKGRGPAELLDLNQMRGMGLQLVAASNQQTSSAVSSGLSSVTSLSTSVSTSLSTVSSAISTQSVSLSQISSSLSGAISSTTSLSSAISTVDSGQSVSLSQISSSLSGEISARASAITSLSAGIVAGTTNWIPLVDGAEPPGFITDGSGHLVLVMGP